MWEVSYLFHKIGRGWFFRFRKQHDLIWKNLHPMYPRSQRSQNLKPVTAWIKPPHQFWKDQTIPPHSWKTPTLGLERCWTRTFPTPYGSKTWRANQEPKFFVLLPQVLHGEPHQKSKIQKNNKQTSASFRGSKCLGYSRNSDVSVWLGFQVRSPVIKMDCSGCIVFTGFLCGPNHKLKPAIPDDVPQPQQFLHQTWGYPTSGIQNSIESSVSGGGKSSGVGWFWLSSY